MAVEGKKALEEMQYNINQQRMGMHKFNREFTNSLVENRQAIEESIKEQTVSRNIFEAESVIIYRATPAQKGQIAELLAQSQKFILAIGDGNKDVAMLKDAHVGVGMGKEGAQASLAADFAVPEFKTLKRLILVHGRYNPPSLFSSNSSTISIMKPLVEQFTMISS